MNQIGRHLITEPGLLLALPIVNLPIGTKRIRIRVRGPVPVLYLKTANSLRSYVAAFSDDEPAIELIPLVNEANYTRSFE